MWADAAWYATSSAAWWVAWALGLTQQNQVDRLIRLQHERIIILEEQNRLLRISMEDDAQPLEFNEQFAPNLTHLPNESQPDLNSVTSATIMI